ncbi:uncharacterized protein LOC114669427 isoform X2 [Erpetoichthys calabaricus]|uniref:uncharacterized protein LOC114669427 isoform X2 n=1 Tax=Erpetoichthys calabaricus TaxID=27687 RepID=UPI002233E361|nr:uncharacterized protein LOC114669427 isoform X2 [Erpetoichthys calabaricus]
MENDLESNCDFNMRMKMNEQWFQQCLEAICEKYNQPFEEDVIVDLDSMTYESSTGVHPWKGEAPRRTSGKDKKNVKHSVSDNDENTVQTAIYRKFPVDYLSQDRPDKRRYVWVKCDEMSEEAPACPTAKDSSFYFSSFVCLESPAANEELKFNLSGSFNADNYETSSDRNNLSSILDLSRVYPLMVAKMKAAIQSQVKTSAANAVQRFYRKLMSHKVKARKMAIVKWRMNNSQQLKEHSLPFCASESVGQPFNTKLIANPTFSTSPSKLGLLQCNMSALSVSSSSTVKKPLMLEASVKPLALTTHVCFSPKEKNKGSPSSPLRVQQLRRTHTEQFMDHQQQMPPSSPSSRSLQISCSFILGTPPRVKQHSDLKKLVRRKLRVESSGDSLSGPSSLQRRHSFSGSLQSSCNEDVHSRFESMYQKLLSPRHFKSYLSTFDVSDVQRGPSMLHAVTPNRKNKRGTFCYDDDEDAMLRKRQRN